MGNHRLGRKNDSWFPRMREADLNEIVHFFVPETTSEKDEEDEDEDEEERWDLRLKQC